MNSYFYKQDKYNTERKSLFFKWAFYAQLKVHAHSK